jgi:hypothetical protein
MRVSHDRQAEIGAAVPQASEGVRMQDADTGVIGLRVKLVIVDERQCPSAVLGFAAKKEGAGLVAPLGPATELTGKLRP